ncbi:Lrp/AsnC family transcriptional regulator [Marinobacter sp. AC-23]|uniref:Lrp/AsnC family transcriptional regulator n=1 Tax=Marinobacter sp. AC-23 TaxID=1879031 RepID=UPI0020C88AD3|nr:Lrp/AsnC family transcriptional regulator [Marinobacter sp. AC-23]
MKQVGLDKLDQRILAILQQDGRISNQQLAEQIGLSPAACWRRVRTLRRLASSRVTAHSWRPSASARRCVYWSTCRFSATP